MGAAMRQHSATVTRVTGLKSAIKGSHCVLAWALARLKAVASTALASERAGHCSNYTRVNATKDTVVANVGVVLVAMKLCVVPTGHVFQRGQITAASARADGAVRAVTTTLAMDKRAVTMGSATPVLMVPTTAASATKDGRETIAVRHGVVTRTRVSMGGRAQHKVPAIPANA
jgi:hypothetical protein